MLVHVGAPSHVLDHAQVNDPVHVAWPAAQVALVAAQVMPAHVGWLA